MGNILNRRRRVAIYGRVSTEHEAQVNAMENQKAWYEGIAQQHPEWSIVGRYFDEGITVERLTRPAAEIDDAILLASEILYDMKSPEDGRPIILQTLREGLSLSSDDEVVGHILKDVCTFSGWTLGMLRDKGFSEATVDSLRP